MNKTLISLVGPTTVGKSTFAASLLDDGVAGNLHPIPLQARRDIRDDDDLRLVSPVTQEAYDGQKMFFDDTPYGVNQRSIDEFLVSNSLLGLSISTPMGLYYVTENLKKPTYSGIARCNIVLTLTNSLSEEIEVLSARIDKYFPDSDANAWRKKHHLDFVEKYFYNPTYLSDVCDLHLVQEGYSVYDWCLQLSEYLGMDFIQNHALLKIAIENNMRLR